MSTNEHATADVNGYEGNPDLKGLARAIASVLYRDGTQVKLSVPFSATQADETAPIKYANESRKVLDALKSAPARPYGEHGWAVPYEGGEALIGDEIQAGYSGIKDEERIDLNAFMQALEDVCSDPGRIKVPPFVEAERGQVSLRRA